MKKELYTVTKNAFHDPNETEVYRGGSLRTAIQSARKRDCYECGCGGPTIRRASDGYILNEWHAGKPFIGKVDNSFWSSPDGADFVTSIKGAITEAGV